MKRIWVPQALCIVMLLWALNPANPYGYYVLLRWVCCAAFSFLTMRAIKAGREGWQWLLGFTAAIYNPIIPVHLARGLWSGLNVATAALAAASIVALRSE